MGERAAPLAYPSALQKRREGGAELRWAWGHPNSSILHRRDLVLGGALAARYDRAGMAHAPAGRGGAAGDEADGRLGAASLSLVLEELGRILLGRAADLTDHDDR